MVKAPVTVGRHGRAASLALSPRGWEVQGSRIPDGAPPADWLISQPEVAHKLPFRTPDQLRDGNGALSVDLSLTLHALSIHPDAELHGSSPLPCAGVFAETSQRRTDQGACCPTAHASRVQQLEGFRVRLYLVWSADPLFSGDCLD